MGIAIVIVVVILIITFGSLVHWLDIILSIIVAPVGAAVLLTLTNRVLGISAMIGLLMLIGIVVTNAVVLIDRVQSNQRERGMNTHDALIEAGNRRLAPDPDDGAGDDLRADPAGDWSVGRRDHRVGTGHGRDRRSVQQHPADADRRARSPTSCSTRCTSASAAPATRAAKK